MADESKTEVGDTYAVSLDSIKAAAKRISGHVKRTPVMTSTRVNEKAGTSLFFKYVCAQPDNVVVVPLHLLLLISTHRFCCRCECFQKTGSFKVCSLAAPP